MKIIDWLKDRFFSGDVSNDEEPIWKAQLRAAPKPRVNRKPDVSEVPEFTPSLGGRIADGGPGKNVLVRNKYVREDTGTHETLKILDESLLKGDEEFGADPYNTGRFDRSESWNSLRSRK